MSETPDQREDELEPTPADTEAAEEASEVMLEADDEAEGTGTAAPEEEPAPSVPAGEPEAPVGPAAPASAAPADPAEAEAEAPKPRRRRRRRAEEAAVAESEAPAAEAPVAEPEAPVAPSRTAGPAPTRRRRGDRPAAPPPVVRAKARYVRSSARKARLVCDHIRGKSVEEARAILAHTPRAVARDWSKLLESAVANAEHNHELVGEDLYVKAIQADEGPTIRRFQPRAMGRATRIRKRTSHLTILLTPMEVELVQREELLRLPARGHAHPPAHHRPALPCRAVGHHDP
jgi:ribosomal protein L22